MHKLHFWLVAFFMFAHCTSIMADDYVQNNDIPYQENGNEYAKERCKLDFYYPTHVKEFPVVVWFHGGGLEGGGKFIPQELKDKGIGVIGVNYRVLPKAGIQECIDDAAAAVAWAFRNVTRYGGSTSKIFVAGHSAGGYLTDMIVLKKDYLQKYGIDADSIAGAFPFSGQVITHFNVRKARGLSSLTPMVDDTAPLYYVRKLPMPFVLLSGDRELELYGRYEEQAYFWRMMQLHQNDQCLLYEMDGYDHGNMPEAGHKIMVRHIKTICDGKKIKR